MEQKIYFILIALLVIAATIYHQAKYFRVERLELKNNKLNTSLRMVQISDFHSNELIKLDRLKEAIRAIDPYFIVWTGDMVEYEIEPTQTFIKEMESLNIPIYMVLGNHDEYHTVAQEYLKICNRYGIKYLGNSNRSIEKDGDIINIIGIKYFGNDYEKAREGIDTSHFNLVLSHAPLKILKSLKGDEDLVLCGHTHGGQIRIPFIGALYAPDEGKLPKYQKGLYRLKNRVPLYVDSGLGNRLLPLRLFNRVQITEIRINE